MIATVPPTLATWLAAARSALIFDAYTVISVGGTVARWIDADFDQTLPDGRAFVRGPQFKRGQIRQAVGLAVDNLSFSIYPTYKGAAVQFGAQTLLQAARRGTLRGATFQLERLVFDAAGAYQGRWVEFPGTLSVESTAGGVIKAKVLSELNLLSTPMPPDVYQGPCKNTVFDTQCGLSRAAWAVSGAVSAVATGDAAYSQFTASGFGQAAGYFDQGVVQFTSGANAGERRTVKSFAGGVFRFALPWPQAIQAGDTLQAVPGCNRSMAMCSGKFNNRPRYRGEPFIPQPETVN